MTLSVLICDDSSFARKQMTRILPPQWDAKISYAENGEQGLEMIRDGKGSVLFLDLTMPVLDGFGVLEQIRAEDLPTLPIVVSGDIQAESRKRVESLGAVAFLKKPVDSELLLKVLKDYGLLQLTTEVRKDSEEKVEFSDWCQEIANISKGVAADLLSQAIGKTVDLSIPSVKVIESKTLFQSLIGNPDLSENYVASQGFSGAGIAGEILMMFHDTNTEDLIDLFGIDEDDYTSSELEALMDTANILFGAFLKSWSDLLDLKFSLGQPLLRKHLEFQRIHDARESLSEQQILSITFDYMIDNRVRCEQQVLFTERSIKTLDDRAKASMEFLS